jgi:DNA-binding response OmpR family regulator
MHSLVRTHILIVGEDEPLLRLIRLTLQLEGWESKIISPHKGLFELLSQDKPDLVILDATMVQWHAMQLTQDVRKHTSAPLLLLTQREHREALFEGANGTLTLPFSMEDLLCQAHLLIDGECQGTFRPGSS